MDLSLSPSFFSPLPLSLPPPFLSPFLSSLLPCPPPTPSGKLKYRHWKNIVFWVQRCFLSFNTLSV